MSPTVLLSALSNPTTASTAFTLLEVAFSTMRLIQNLDSETMTPEEKRTAWREIQRLNVQADMMLETAITSHPAWLDGPGAQIPKPE